MNKKLVSMALIVSQVVFVTPSYSYKRSTHQHITELAYAIIKHAELCQLSDVSRQNMNYCIEECKANQKLITENDKARCVDACQTDNYPAPNGLTELDQIESKRFCAEVYGEFLQKYRNKKAPYNLILRPNGHLNSRTGFYQNFKATACPPKNKYDYDLSDIGCANYDRPLDALKAGKELYGFFSLNQELKLYTRAMHETLPVLNKRDVSYEFIDDMGNDVTFNLDYTPIAPVFSDPYEKQSELRATNYVGFEVNGVFVRQVDLTGTILGYYAGATDLFHDLYTNVRLLPIVEDVLKTIAEGTVGVVGAGVGAIWFVGAILVCSASCALSWIFDTECKACFDKGFKDVGQYFEDVGERIESIEQESFISVMDSPTLLGHNGTSFFHFMNTSVDYQNLGSATLETGFVSLFDFLGALFEHDDVDGYRGGEAFGVLGGLITQGILEASQLDVLAADLRVTYKRSKHSVLNYQVMNADDAPNENSSKIPGFGTPQRNVFYWQRMGFTDYTFPPVDNLAYYWWHVWWDARASGQEDLEEMGLLPLGAVLHAVQDITQPLHARGLTLYGHQSYEADIDDRMDHTMMLLNRADLRAPLIFDLSTNAGQRDFVVDILRKFMILYSSCVNENGVLDIRKLMHTLYFISYEVDENIYFDTSDGWESLLTLFVKRLITDDYSRKEGLPYAIAASMLVLMEASREDIAVYEVGLNLDNFRNYTVKNGKYFDDEGGTWSNLGTVRQPLSGGDGASYISTPQSLPTVWQCAGALPEVQRAVSDYIDNKAVGRDVLKIVLSAHLACEIQEAGLPMPPRDYLERVAKLKADELESRMMLMSHGDMTKYHREMACAHKEEWEAAPVDERFYDDNRYRQLSERCEEVLDSDGDGVLDQVDECYTPVKVLNAPGVVIKPNGCAFDHEYKRGERAPSLNVPGAKVVKRSMP